MNSARSLQDIKDSIAIELYGETTKDAQSSDIPHCISCKKPINVLFYPYEYSDSEITFEESKEGDIYTNAGLNEYKISGLCEHCFDKATMTSED